MDLTDKVKVAAALIEDGKSYDDVLNSDDIIELIMTLNDMSSRVNDPHFKDYIEEGLISTLTGTYRGEFIDLGVVDTIMNLPENAEMFSICEVERGIFGLWEPVTLIKGETKWLPII